MYQIEFFAGTQMWHCCRVWAFLANPVVEAVDYLWISSTVHFPPQNPTAKYGQSLTPYVIIRNSLNFLTLLR